MTFLKNYFSDILSILISTSFGLLTHSAFVSEDILIVMTISFLFILPAAIGALSVWPLLAEPNINWTKSILRPWVPCLLFMFILVAFNWEAWGCVLLASPIVFLLASIGGAVVFAIHKSQLEVTNLSLLIFLASPFALAPLEGQIGAPIRETITQVSIQINATPAEVWAQIGNVPEIPAKDQGATLLNAVGIPRPIQAEMGEIELGAVRIATFEDGLQFREVVTEMEHEKSVTYSIEAVNQALLPAPLNQIDGEYLDLKSARYVIEPAADGTVTLHLISTHTLTTQFNLYGALWTNWLMADFQNNLLQVIKSRAETH